MELPITQDTIIRTLIAQYPQTRKVFEKYGMAACQNHGPEGPEKPIWFFAERHGVPLPQLLSELSASISVDTL